MTVESVRACLGAVTDPELGRSWDEARMIDNVELSGAGEVRVAIELPTPAYPDQERIAPLVQKTLHSQFPNVGNVAVDVSWKVRGKESGGSIGLRCKNVVAVGSGKGGVGKSTVAAALAYGLHTLGAKVGLMDADVYGPSIPHMLGVQRNEPPAVEEIKAPSGETIPRMEAIDVNGLKTMSMGYHVPDDKPIIWRGPMLHRTLQQFLQLTDWGELDYMIIDLPPGTGDVTLSLSQMLGLAGAVVVCTPQQVALLDAIRALKMFDTVKIPVLGFVENMSGEVFGSGGAQQAAEKHGVPFLGELPIDPQIRIESDAGRLQALFDEQSAPRPHLIKICQRVAIEIAKNSLSSSTMPTLEVL